MEGVPVLHGIEMGQGECVSVDIPEGVVTNPPGTAFALWDHSWRAEREIGKCFSKGVG